MRSPFAVRFRLFNRSCISLRFPPDLVMNSRFSPQSQQPLLPGMQEDGNPKESHSASLSIEKADVPAQSDTSDELPFEETAPTVSIPNDPLVMVVDTHAILYQVFHAMPPMTSPEGLPIGAIHGMLRDLLEIRQRYRPDFLFFTFDLSEDTFRNAIYPEYKGHREEMPADLRLQMPLAREALEALHVPILEIVGYEADDIIATIATQAHERLAMLDRIS
jgi:DNA polymerase I